MKYIDADRLRKEVKWVEKAAHKIALGCADREKRKFHEGKDSAYQYVGILIDRLQQEQPEVDLEKEFNDFLEKQNACVNDDDVISYYNDSSFNHTYDIYPIARHFYELGLRGAADRQRAEEEDV